jgi:lipopolysaccharide export system protein LptA
MRVVGLFACLLLSLTAHAEKADRSKPVNLEADSVRVIDAQRTAIYEGHVVMTQGTMMMTADLIEVRQDERGFSVGGATGKPVYFRQKLEGRADYAEGWADSIIYDARAETLELSGQARLKRGDDELRGNRIMYDAKTEFYQAQGGGNGVKGRVRAVILPKSVTPSQAVKP